ncbi:MAG TPA: hypothetical protein VM869_30870, partial [Enhygromyxa sp.]|nr:hypothetical protein [Enhygromyxa sp.]
PTTDTDDPTTDTDDPTTDTDDPTADTGEPCDSCEIGQLCSGGDFCQWVCGWNGGYYTCDAMGTSPTDPIECPAGDYIPGAACPPGLTYEGCCDEYGDSWWCEDAVIKLQECT